MNADSCVAVQMAIREIVDTAGALDMSCELKSGANGFASTGLDNRSPPASLGNQVPWG